MHSKNVATLLGQVDLNGDHSQCGVLKNTFLNTPTYLYST